MDEHIGRVFDAMKEAGIYEDSMIIFTSDHGEEFYDHGGWWHGRTLYEEQIHVPLIVKLPGSKHAGAVDDRLVRHVDLPSTILRVADITTRAEWPADAPGDPLPLPDAMEGIPLFGDGLDPRNATIQHAYAETDHEGNQVEAVRTLTHKYVEANEGNPRGLPPVALYELPDEATNHAGEMTYVQDELDATLDGYREGTAESAVEAEQAELTPEERQRLQDLGYGGE
jgi:arylsulfatase A-like enzyme